MPIVSVINHPMLRPKGALHVECLRRCGIVSLQGARDLLVAGLWQHLLLLPGVGAVLAQLGLQHALCVPLTGAARAVMQHGRHLIAGVSVTHKCDSGCIRMC